MMAALVLTAAASALTSSLGVTGVFASLITAAATVAGTMIDRALFTPSTTRTQEGPRLQSTLFMASIEGSPILRGYGLYKVGGQVIWATRFEEEVVTETVTEGGKGGPTDTTITTTYRYYANFAVGICEGEVGTLYRVWADAKELLDLSEFTYRFYNGTESQTPDSLITTKEGSGNVPGYRGLSYIVFERMPLGKFGNRIPQLTFELDRPVIRDDDSSVESLITAVNLIPGSGEFTLEPEEVRQLVLDGNGDVIQRKIENTHMSNGDSDWNNAMEQMAKAVPELETVCLVITWYGDDLRCGNCTIRPKVENDSKVTSPYSWLVAGVDRTTAQVITQIDGRPAFGGTPNDASVRRAAQDLKDRGYKVMFYPFIMMDIPSGNTLPNPYSNNAATNGQPVFPWRGRITCSPAAGYTGTVDKTATAATQVDNFVNGTWGFRNFVLHYANLLDDILDANDYFCIGTEMVGMTQIRSDADTYPFVDELVTLAEDVKDILIDTKVGYAADWSEYHSHRPSDGSNDVFFNLDPLWSSADIDFVGIDNYLPLADWRDGVSHLDAQAGYKSIYDIDYLKSNIEGGEYFDWYYASAADRVSQTRSTISSWVYGNKNIRGWWENEHHNRPGGVPDVSPTAWTAEGKQIIFTEFGCPAIDKGPNQPNVFYDPKSSESFVPYFSNGNRDDVGQRQYIRAMIEYWTDTSNNPVSSEYGGRMIHMTDMFYWAYDSRPWPSFPRDANAWSDKPNWQYGHWISHRAGTVYVADLLARLAEEYGFTNYDFSRAYGSCDGYVLDNVMSFRSAVEPLMAAFMFELVEGGATIQATSKYEMNSVFTLTLDDVLDRGDDEPVMMTRAQETELPATVTMRFMDIDKNYEQASVSASREIVTSDGTSVADVPIVIDYTRAQQLVDRWVYTVWAQRETADFGLMPEFIGLEPGDVVTLNVFDFSQEVRIQAISDAQGRMVSAQTFDRAAMSSGGAPTRTTPGDTETLITAPIVVYMDLPMLTDFDTEWAPYVAAYMEPWVNGVSIHRSATDSNYSFNTHLDAPAKMGYLEGDLYSGPLWVWDDVNDIYVTIYSGTLESLTDEEVYAGANALAVQNDDGGWEIIQFGTAELLDVNKYKLSHLLRGQRGTDDQMGNPSSTGNRVVFLNLALKQLATSVSDIGNEFYYKSGPTSEPISSELYSTDQETFTGRGLYPYSPVNVEGYVETDDDVVISWQRRTRIGGDNWVSSGDVPWSEAIHKFEVDILDGSDNVVRTFEVEEDTSVTYTAAQQSADSITIPFTVVVYQMSDTVGRGIGRRETLYG